MTERMLCPETLCASSRRASARASMQRIEVRSLWTFSMIVRLNGRSCCAASSLYEQAAEVYTDRLVLGYHMAAEGKMLLMTTTGLAILTSSLNDLETISGKIKGSGAGVSKSAIRDAVSAST